MQSFLIWWVSKTKFLQRQAKHTCVQAAMKPLLVWCWNLQPTDVTLNDYSNCSSISHDRNNATGVCAVYVCVCVCVCVWQRDCVCERESVCVWEKEGREIVCVRERERECVCVCVYVCTSMHVYVCMCMHLLFFEYFIVTFLWGAHRDIIIIIQLALGSFSQSPWSFHKSSQVMLNQVLLYSTQNPSTTATVTHITGMSGVTDRW